MEEDKVEIRYNSAARILKVKEEIIFLTNDENKIMGLLVKNIGKITLKKDIWKLFCDNEDDVLDSAGKLYLNQKMVRFRKKINKYFELLTIPGEGYILIKRGQSIKDGDNDLII
jgi:DNA-binding response OmpR family regulator